MDKKVLVQDKTKDEPEFGNAYRDELTGAILRDAGHDLLGRAVDRAHRSGTFLAIAVVGVDNLKRTNDRDGSSEGDRLLREVGSALLTTLRSYDLVVRDSDDEFVCALEGSQLADAEARFTEVSLVLSKAMPGASVNVGLVELRPEEKLERVIERADRLMSERRWARRASRKT